MDILTATKHLYTGAKQGDWHECKTSRVYKFEKEVNIPDRLFSSIAAKEMACYVLKAAGEFSGFFVGMAGMEARLNEDGSKLILQVMDQKDADAFDAGKTSDFPERVGLGKAEYVESYTPLPQSIDFMGKRDSQGWREEADAFVKDVPASHGGPGQALLVPSMMSRCNQHLGLQAMEYIGDPHQFDKAVMRVKKEHAQEALVGVFGLDGKAIGLPEINLPPNG